MSPAAGQDSVSFPFLPPENQATQTPPRPGRSNVMNATMSPAAGQDSVSFPFLPPENQVTQTPPRPGRSNVMAMDVDGSPTSLSSYPMSLSSPSVVGNQPTDIDLDDPRPAITAVPAWDVISDDETQPAPEYEDAFEYPATPTDYREPAPTSGRTTIYDFLMNMEFPPCPPDYGTHTDKLVLAGTKRINPRYLRQDRELLHIVYVPDMLEDIATDLKDRFTTRAMTIDWSNTFHRDWAIKLHTYHTRQGLTELLRCEKDIEQRMFPMVFHAAVAALRVLEQGKIPQEAPSGCPYACFPIQDTSAGAVVSDMYLLKSERPNEEIVMQGELKCPNVLQQRYAAVNEDDDSDEEMDDPYLSFRSDSLSMPSRLPGPTPATSKPEPSSNGHIFQDIQEHNIVFRPGDAISFNWPRTITKQDKLTKVLMQLWEQLIQDDKHPESLVLLSSYQWTTFVVRKKNTMYVSDNYGDKSGLLFYSCCAMARALRLTDAEFRLPDPKTDWWPEDVLNTWQPAGVVKRTMPYSKQQVAEAAEASEASSD